MYLNNIVTPEEIICEIIKRSDSEKDMNIWITPPNMDMIKPYIDRIKKVSPSELPLWGVPFAIKDNIDLKGVPTTAACPKYSYIPDENAVVVERLIEAGAIPVGKTNLDQFATGLVGTRSPYGEVKNSLKPELISGGSSAGSAVSIARGQSAFALGTDTAGSGRVPAALNKIIGYKPSVGAWPIKGLIPACSSIDCISVFTNNMEDAIEVDNIVRGIDDTDPWSRNIPKPVVKAPKKICLPSNPLYFFGQYADKYKNAWDTAIKAIKKLNITIEYIDYSIFEQAAKILYDGPWIAERWSDLGAFVKENANEVFPITEQILRTGERADYDAAAVFKAKHELQKVKLKTRKILNNAVLMMPTCGGTWTRDEVRKDPIGTNSDLGRYTNHCNLLELCAAAVPSLDADINLPFGVTFFGLSENEDIVLGISDLFTKNIKEGISIAVCGLHMTGCKLEHEMNDFGAKFVRKDKTAAKYEMIKLECSPAKPGLIKKDVGGSSINLEIWEMPADALGKFIARIPSPLGFGKIELADGSEVPGFICEAYAEKGAENITTYGGWREYLINF